MLLIAEKMNRPRRTSREEREAMKGERLALLLNESDDSKHGLEVTDFQNKGRGIKVGLHTD